MGDYERLCLQVLNDILHELRRLNERHERMDRQDEPVMRMLREDAMAKARASAVDTPRETRQ